MRPHRVHQSRGAQAGPDRLPDAQYGQEYRDAGERYYEEKYQSHLIRRLHKQAAAFGFQLAPQQGTVTTVS